MVTGEAYAKQAVNGGYIGIPYSELDCQGFVEKVLADCGVRKPDGKKYNWRGTNSMWRNYYQWRGTRQEAIEKFGLIPEGAWLFHMEQDGGEIPLGYNDGLGNFKHVGIYLGDPHGSIHSTTGGVQFLKYPDKRWTHVMLPDMLDYMQENPDNKIKDIIANIRKELDEMERMV